MKRTCVSVVAGVALAALLYGPSPALAQVAPPLGGAESFAVLGGSTVTNTGSSVISGNLGVSPGSAITGFPPGIVVGGTIHAADAVALAAQTSLTTAYNNLAGQACNTDLTGQDLGGMTLTPGVYCFSTSAQLTGTLTLDGQGSADAVFVFQIGSTLTTATNASVLMINSGSECNVFWQVGSSATLGTTTTFAGNILALTSITLNTGATMAGRALARNGAVTLDTNTVDRSMCAVAPCPEITLHPATLPGGTQGVPYRQRITATGGTPPYVFTLIDGTLPPGLTLTPAGMLSGTPTTNGSSTFTIQGTDANGCIAVITYTLVVISPVPTLPQWAAMLLAAGLLGLGYLRLRRRSGGVTRPS